MSDAGSSIIGHVSDVAGSRIIANLLTDEEGFQQSIIMDDEKVLVGQLGTQVLITHGDLKILGQIIRMWMEPREVHATLTGQNTELTRPITDKKIEILPLGEISVDGTFYRGVTHYPVLNANVTAVAAHEMETLFHSFREHNLPLGRLSNKKSIEVFLDPNPMFTRHLAILGQSGAGKSWTVSSLIQRAVKTMPKAHIVMLDIHGEYGWRDTDGKIHSAFPEDIVRHIDARELEIPYWLLTYAELIDLLIDRTDPNASVQMAFMRDVLFSLRKKSNAELNLSQLSVDSPVFFSLKEMYMHFKKANEQQLDFGKSKGTLFGAFDEFLVRFQSMYNDSRYDFLLKPKKRKSSMNLESLLRDFVGLGSPKRQVTVVDLSPVPSDIRPMVAAQIGRLAFEFNYWNPKRREFPLLLVCEEAHQYLPREEATENLGARKAMEKIAKEGRKYGVSLCVVSQRPTDLSSTVLSQCSNYICLRVSNPIDQEYIKGLMPEGQAGLADVMASLRRGEALILGDAAPLPTRIQIYPPDPPPASSDVPLSDSWRHGAEDLDVKDIVHHWWEQKR